MPIVPIFIFLCLLIFGVVAIATRPSNDQKAVSKRIAAVKSPEGSLPESDELHKYLKTLQRGQFGWLEDLVEDTDFQRSTQLLILQANRTTSVGNVMVTCGVAGLGVLALVYLVTSSSLVALPVAAVAGFMPILLMRLQRKSRINKFNKALPDCIDLMARSLRAGHAMMAALNIVAAEAVEPAKTEFSEVCRKQNYGLPMRDALMQLLDRMPSQDLRVLVTGMLVQKDTGGNLAEILDRILFVVKERMRIQGEIKTHTAQGRLTGWILCALPIIMLGLINIINPGYSKVLFDEPMGHKLLGTGVALLIIGGLIIRQIINGIEV
jgi:tight adherence protein B